MKQELKQNSATKRTEVVPVELPGLVLLSALKVVLESLFAVQVVLLAQFFVLKHLVGSVDSHKLRVSIFVVLKMEK